MFLWRWFKRLAFFVLFALIAYVASGKVMWHGRPARDHVITFFQSTQWKEGMKDLRMWLGALLQVAGKKIEEGVTAEDQKKLDLIIEQDLQKHIEGMKSEAQPK